MLKSIDPAEGIMSIKVLPGEFYVTQENERIETIMIKATLFNFSSAKLIFASILGMA